MPAGLTGITSIYAFEDYTLALKADGAVTGWGPEYENTLPAGLTNIVAISKNMALDSSGILRMWGSNNKGQATIPGGLSDAVMASATISQTLSLKEDGTVVTSGFWDNSDQIPAPIPAGLTNVIKVASGASIGWTRAHSLALRSDGSVVGWGDNSRGQSTIPGGLDHVIGIAAGVFQSLALKSDGTVMEWGQVDAIPVGLNNVMMIAAGGDQNVALKTDGTIVAWGNPHNVPANLNNVTSISAGLLHCLALKSDGTVTAWGDNGYGQVTVPSGLTNVVAVAAGDHHSVALRADGTVIAWGGNDRGQITVPGGLTNVIAISAGVYHTAAIVALPPEPFPSLHAKLEQSGLVISWLVSPKP